jgi:hypothetical protein
MPLSPITNASKNLVSKPVAVTRTMTTAAVVEWVPKGARIVGFVLSGTASNAGTTATLSVGTTSTSNEYVSAVNVLAAGSGNGVSVLNGVAGAVGSVLTVDTPIYVKYAETGVASSAGAWTLWIVYVM